MPGKLSVCQCLQMKSEVAAFDVAAAAREHRIEGWRACPECMGAISARCSTRASAMLSGLSDAKLAPAFCCTKAAHKLAADGADWDFLSHLRYHGTAAIGTLAGS